MIVQTSYGFHESKRPVLIICPHDSDGQAFFSHFPSIWESPDVQKVKNWFWRYLRIEQDYGAARLAHALAKVVQSSYPALEVRVVELDYPRAIIDGGRQPESCLRNCLPPGLMSRLGPQFLEIHQKALAIVKQQIQRVQAKGGLFIDLHTMAPCTPKGFDAGNGHVEVSFDDLADYVGHFLEASSLGGELRAVDLITEDGKGQFIADRHLSELLLRELSPSYPVQCNKPFAALPHYMMHEYMQACPGIAIDVPKHLLMRESLEQKRLCLYNFELCSTKIRSLAKRLAKALGAYFGLSALSCHTRNHGFR